MSGTGGSSSNIIKLQFSSPEPVNSVDSAGVRVGARLDLDQTNTSFAKDLLDVRRLLIDDSDSKLSNFISLSDGIRRHFETCIELIDSDDLFAADNELMLAKRDCQKLFLFRDISDAVGLVSLKLCQAAISIDIAARSPNIIKLMIKSLNAIASSPYMSFDQASLLADDIEAVAGRLYSAGYGDLVGALVE